MRIRKFVEKTILFFGLCFGMLLFSQMDVHAEAYIDEEGYFVYETQDVAKTSSIYYRSNGWTISRGKQWPELHDGKATEYIYVPRRDMIMEWVNVGGVIICQSRIHLSVLLAGASEEWKQEVLAALNGTGPAVYLRIDGSLDIWYGDGVGYDDLWLSGPYRNHPPIDGTNPAQIQAAQGWRNPRGLASHYNIWCPIGIPPVEPPEEIAPDAANTKISSEYAKAKFAVGNASPDGYDLSQGIPSGKAVTVSYEASKWYGSTDVWARTVKTDQYQGIHYEYTYDLGHMEPNQIEDPDNPGHKINDPNGGTHFVLERTVVLSGSFDETIGGTTSMVPVVSYQYLANANFYDFSNMEIHNLAYPGTVIFSSEQDAPANCISTQKYVNVADFAIGSKPLSSWYADDAKHITWATIDKSTRTNGGNPQFTSEADAQAAMQEWFVSTKQQIQNEISNGTITRNDVLTIDGTNYMVAAEGSGVNWTLDGGLPSWNFCSKSAAARSQFRPGSITNASIPMESGTETLNIPTNTENGKYATGVKVSYTRRIKNDGTLSIFHSDSGGEWYAGKSNYERLSNGHCKDSYNGYINVHTPVIAPVVVLDGDGNELTNDIGNTQLAGSAYNPDAVYQMVLDENYVLDWESAVHRNIPNYGDSGKYSKYDEFVQDKWVRFPFDVIYDGKLYTTHAVNETMNAGTSDAWTIRGNYTDWIKIKQPSSWNAASNMQAAGAGNNWTPTSANHWKQTPIYIPSFAEEVGKNGEDAYIYYKVEAYNVDGRYSGSHTEEQQAIYNKNYTYTFNGAEYVATYKFQVQLSGVIYDFMITGTSDAMVFDYEYTGSQVDLFDYVAFCAYKEEKRVGTKNRFGEDAVRYRIDGSLTDDWSKVNTLPLAAGKSNCFPAMGYVTKGTNFSFSLKTIANLWDITDDEIIIKPSFRYIRPDGTTTENIKVYYNTEDKSFVEFGSEYDKNTANMHKVKLIDGQFDESYYDWENSWTRSGYLDYQVGDWIRKSTDYYNLITGENLAEQSYMWRETPCSSLSLITLNSRLRFLSGEWEQLQMNTRGNGKAFENIIRYSDYDGWNDDLQSKFEKSMQTWYGKYYIPSEIYIVDLDKKGLDDSFDLMQYIADKGGIRYDDEIFVENEGYGGYLVINFDISTKNDGEDHLVYGGNGADSKNMWEKEGGDDEVFVGTDPFDMADPDTPGKDPGDPADPSAPGAGTKIELKDGDVAIIDLGSSIKDRYKGAIFNIN